VENGYYETYNRDNVTLLDISATPIEEITPTGIRVDGVEHEIDVLIFATGFDALTGAPLRINPTGRGGLTLRQAWADGASTYLGLTVAGFPNLFLITGPGSPSVFSNMVVSIEQHVEWVTAALVALRETGRPVIEATGEAQQNWTEQCAAIGNASLFPQAQSWYMGANVPGKPRQFLAFLGGVGGYRQICDEVAANGYPGFELSALPEPVLA
jgi:cyclohexanone monooxygenase